MTGPVKKTVQIKTPEELIEHFGRTDDIERYNNHLSPFHQMEFSIEKILVTAKSRMLKADWCREMDDLDKYWWQNHL